MASMPPIIEVAQNGPYGPTAVRVKIASGRGTARGYGQPVLVSEGDVFRGRGKDVWRTLTVRSFTDGGRSAYVDRNSSRRRQSVLTARLVTEYDGG